MYDMLVIYYLKITSTLYLYITIAIWINFKSLHRVDKNMDDLFHEVILIKLY